MAESVTVNITPGEILQPGAAIELRAGRPVDPASPRARSGSRPVRRPVRSPSGSRPRGRVLRLATEGLAPASTTSSISELLGAKGERLVDRLVIPFLIVPISGEVPSDAARRARRPAPGRRPGRRSPRPGTTTRAGHVDVVKAVGRKDGQPVQLAFDERGSRASTSTSSSAAWRRRRSEKFGRLDETLWTHLEGAPRTATGSPIVIWPRLELPPAPYEKPTDRAPARGARRRARGHGDHPKGDQPAAGRPQASRRSSSRRSTDGRWR